jgi:hypothetical protein
MHSTGIPVHLSVLAWMAPLAAVAWSALAGGLSKAQIGSVRSLLPAGLTGAAIAAVTAAARQWAVSGGVETGPSGAVWTQVAAGAVACLAGLAAAGLSLPKEGDAGAEGRALAGVPGPALAVPALLGAYLLSKHTARAPEWLAISPLGAAATAAAIVMAVRGTGGGAALRRIPEALETVAAGCAVAAFGILLGKMHYAPKLQRAGDAVVLFLAASLGVWLVLNAVQRLFFPASRGAAALWGIAYCGFSGWFAWLLARAVHTDAQAAWCIWAGLGAGAAVALLCVSGAMEERSPQERTASLAAAAAVLAAAALSLRFQTGFGLALCAAGLLAALPLWSLLTPWMTLPSRTRFPFPLTWGAGYLSAWCALRIWLEWHGAASVPVSSPYAFLGLSTGLALPFVLASLAGGQEETPSRAGAAIGAVMLPVATGAILALISIVLREPAVRLFLLGCGAAGLAAPFVLAASPALRSIAPAVSGGLTAVCLALVTAGALQQWSEEATRAGKLRVLVIATAVLAAGYLLAEGRRVAALRRQTPRA